MCGLCGSFTEIHWSAGPAAASRPAVGRSFIAGAAGRALAGSGIRIAAWGQGFRLTGPTGRTELAADLGAIWQAAERLGRRPVDPLDPDWIDRQGRG